MTSTLSHEELAAPSGDRSLGFIPTLDGVRALAVILVIGFHGGWFHLGGGFIGVDVFFVLSGFLITRLLLDEHARTGSISLRNFYIRRSLRLFPALAGVVGGVWLAAALLDSPGLRRHLAARSFWAVSYVANWHDVVTHTHGGPFSHLWSLSVEEQFYAVWPMVVVTLVRRRGVSGVRNVAGVGYIVAAVTTAIRSRNGASGFGLYFSTHSHGLVLLLAGACLGASPRLLEALSEHIAHRLVAIGAAGIAGLALLPNYDNPLHPALGYLPVTAFSLALVAGATVVRDAGPLNWAPLRRIGASSYGIYLWHIPMFAIAGAVAPSLDPRVGILSGTAVATVLSHHLIEQPALRYKDRCLRR